ncbi:hypothetical protein XMM379_001908 [Aliiroseovarius sp. xm-m-379]|uniref:Flp pilus-assembly TadG-like N-terminal domain-containing protein n=2 Tax=Aliiroseovarius TaxID=1658781 RepID=A0A9Q9HDT1_9RHOB|nr:MULTISPECIES: TadE/TadG family type IV pilus assembly protein [Aliiroseovarius]NRP25215.1 hypothetical protein [Aliiroseovarius sp. xm-m-379]NRP50808.1 hypothetical protein [Aliiroseovarius sp. xm-m-354]NRP11992.1 hypothetical protein [Aliiroseovarius sp. xm-d-517]NRP31053.1 hypothetical protein [Aliiroseovarius sp. xm-m-314]NRP34014.1 hypothetical protein [Aliiroseovarius sp. xm-a-104]
MKRPENMRTFRQSEDGALTVFGLYIFATMILLAAIAIDMTQLITARTQLQVTADQAAHAALYSRDTNSAETAKLAALNIVETAMPKDKFGQIITLEDITFGTFDYVSGGFLEDPTSRKSVLINSGRLSETGNPVTTLLLDLIGYSSYDMTAQSIFTTYRPACFREGFVANDEVDIQSNNAFTNGFCIHSNSYVSLNSNNIFDEGTVVSMPNLADLDLPNSGWETNEGLQSALREGSYRLRIINKLEDIIDGLLNADPDVLPDYVDETLSPIYMTPPSGKGLSMSDLTAGRVHYLDCHNNGVLKLYDDSKTVMAISNVVILTPCEIQFGQEVVIEDAIIATTNTYVKAITSSSNLQIGRDDNCAAGGGAQILSMGGMEFSSGLSIFGSQLLAKKDIAFTANADGIQGASIISEGSISGTSNMNMGFCGTGMESNFEAEYFRLAH